MEVDKHPNIDQLKSRADLEWVEKHIDSCERCRSMVEGLELLNQHREKDQSLDQMLNSSMVRTWNLIDEQLPTQRSNKKVWYGAMAGALVLIVGVWAVFSVKSSDGMVDWEAPYPAPAFRSNDLGISGTFGEYYQQGQYKEARKELKKEATSGENQFYIGLTYLYQEEPRPDSALHLFNSDLVLQSLYMESARFYAAIAHIKLGDTIQSKELLNNILAQEHHANRREAAALLELLDN
ncbi:MAG: hypothetical protein R8G66_18790 [Cytophagales bacterium]|nr:hypothetical protein [Cytophagales bacterium]